MKLAIMQPYFMPYIGYWQLMNAVDTYVVYDDVNYIKGKWVARNNVLMNSQPHLFTITLNGASSNKLFYEITIRDDFVKFRKMLHSCYCHAPYYSEVMRVLESIFLYEDKGVGNFMLHSFKEISDYVGIKTKFLLSSEIDKDNSLRGASKVMHICQKLKADIYINAIGGQNLYDKNEFLKNGIVLKFLKPELMPYKQFDNDFVSGLSIIDVMMFNSVAEIKFMLDEFELV